MPQQYLSTDPNAGLEQNADAPQKYLSTDPNAGTVPEVKSKAARFGESFVRNILPSTRASDYLEGPAYAAQHPLDALGLIVNAFIGSHKDQAVKTGQSAGRVFSEPTLGGKLGAASETLGHGLATVVPMIGPAAANAGEQLGSGDVAGGLGAMTGLLTPSAVAAGAGRVAPKAATALHESAIEGVQKAINPTRVDTKVRTQRIAPEMLKRRVTAGNLQKLEELAETKSAAAGAKVEQALTPHKNATVDTMSIVDALEQAKQPYIGKTTTGAPVVNDASRVKAIDKLQSTLMDYGNDISVESMVKLRRNLDQVVEAGKGFTTPKAGVKAWAAREGRTALRDELVKAVPNLDKVNAEYAFWQTLEDVAHASNQRKTGQKGNLVSSVAGGAGAIAAEVAMPGGGLLKGGLQAALGAKVFSSLRRFVDSPGYQLWSAVQKERLADALMAQSPSRVQGLIHQGMVAASKTSRSAGRLQSGRPVPQAAENKDDSGFEAWYSQMAKRYDLNPDPNSADQFYDYRAAFKAGAKPDESGHWPSQFKRKGHPNEIVGGFNTRTGEPEPGHNLVLDVQKLIELGWDPSTAKQLVAKARRPSPPVSARGTRR